MPESKTIAAMLKKFNFGCFIGIEKKYQSKYAIWNSDRIQNLRTFEL